MAARTAPVLGLRAADWAALLAGVAHLRATEDGDGAVASSWISGGRLALGAALDLFAKGL